jgi:hypothetical protein
VSRTPSFGPPSATRIHREPGAYSSEVGQVADPDQSQIQPPSEPQSWGVALMSISSTFRSARWNMTHAGMLQPDAGETCGNRGPGSADQRPGSANSIKVLRSAA